MSPQFVDNVALLFIGAVLTAGVGVMGWIVRAVLALRLEVARLAQLVEDRTSRGVAP